MKFAGDPAVDDGLKKRLIGATVLVSLAVIFIPMLLEDEPVIETGIYKTNIPKPPGEPFPHSALPDQQQDLALPPRELVKPVRKTAPKPSAEPAAKPELPSEVTKVIKPEPEKTRVGLAAWVIQVGSFSNRENADRLIASLRKAGFNAFIEQTEVKGKQLYRVRVGPEISKEKAREMLKRLDTTLKPMKLKGTLESYP